MITQSKLKELLHYDPVTGDFTRLVANSNRIKVGDIAGFVNSEGYKQLMINNKTYYAHRLAWLYIYGEFPKNHIDHINGNKKDNRIANLRECTNRENHQNITSQKNSTSKYLGVSWSNKHNKWFAQISFNYQKKYLGLFDNEEEAFAAYLKAKKQLHTFNPTVRGM
jgi:hypothetical protein